MTGALSMTGRSGIGVLADALLVRLPYSKTGKNVGVDNNRCPHHVGRVGYAAHNSGSDMEIIEDHAALSPVKASETYLCTKKQGKSLKNDSKASISDGSQSATNGSCGWTIVLDPIFTYLGRVMRVDKARFELAASSLRTKRSNRADLLAHQNSR